MALNKLVLFLFVQVFGTVFCQSPPVWPDSYEVSGSIDIPFALIDEPFTGWYDAPSKNSRIDWYNGMAKHYELGQNGYGQYIKVVPMTDEEVTNQTTCFLINGSEDNPIEPQIMLPKLDEFIQEESQGGLEIWTLTKVENERINRYTMQIKIDEDGTRIPVFFLMYGYNILLGSHYDQYRVHYTSYKPFVSSQDVFKVEPEGLVCRDFPGPGNKHTHSVNPMAEFMRSEKTDHIDYHFEEFKNTHGKKYDTKHEHLLRKEIFKQNFRYIESVNRQNKGYTLAVNHLADRTDDEIKFLRGRVASGGYNGGAPFPHSNVKDDDVPDSIDWRFLGAVTPVKDQAICGSCWSFGTAGTIEGALFLKTGKLTRLSEQALVDCSWGFGNNGCDGGEDFRSYQWIMKHGGIPTDSSYGNYLGEDGWCHADSSEKVAAMSGYVNVTTNDVNALRLALFKYGPVSVSIDASQKSFSFYSGGVYYDENCGNKDTDLDHSVLAVGYGTVNGEDYWLIKNSWSTHWGTDGYILMSARDNNCGVMTMPTYVTLA